MTKPSDKTTSPDNAGNDQHASPLLSTPLLAKHHAAGAKIVDFGGWALPVNYGSQIEEHHAVRNACGMFDVSHMTVSDVTGPDTLRYLGNLLANDIRKVSSVPGKALYSCMLNEQGGVIDDLIVYYLDEQHCRLVTNANTNEKDMAWMQKQSSGFDVAVEERPDLALLAVQGPKALDICQQVLENGQASLVAGLQRFQGGFSGTLFVGRTGYTGEDGVEFIAPAEQIIQLWDAFMQAGVQPCGLGARDTLRLESGMSLYGNDLDEQHNPYQSGLKWSVSLNDDRDFIGKAALLESLQHEHPKSMIGLQLLDRGVLRGHQSVVLDGQIIGEITSGTFSPTLQKSIALARIERQLENGAEVHIQVRNKQLKAQVVKYPFVKNGEATS